MPNLVCHAANRIEPPGTNGRWKVTNLSSKRQYSFSKTAVMVLISFIGGADERAVADSLGGRFAIPTDAVREAVELLRELGLLTSAEDPTNAEAQRLCQEWAKFGWIDTADYQLGTLDYPFADYASDGREIDFQRMKEYIATEPDVTRLKSHKSPSLMLPTPTASDAIGELGESFADVWLNDPPLQTLDAERCKKLMASVFGVLRKRRLSDSPDVIADAIGKTSPSGGSRHPTEAYLFACSVAELPAGVYHFNMAGPTLDRIADLDTSESALLRMFSGPMRASFAIDAFVVMTSVFDRAMWRYREPRSFRAIYMDVGHLSGTMDFVAKALGLNCLVQHGVSEDPIAQILGIHPLEEGVIYGAAIGGARRGAL